MSSDDPQELPVCPECNGAGHVEVVVKGAVDGGDAVRLEVCPECQGTGEEASEASDAANA